MMIYLDLLICFQDLLFVVSVITEKRLIVSLNIIGGEMVSHGILVIPLAMGPPVSRIHV